MTYTLISNIKVDFSKQKWYNFIENGGGFIDFRAGNDGVSDT